MKKIELLAPAGNMESLKAAVQGGCDAVYLGMKTYSARAFAGNFDEEELKEAVHYCHARNVSVYVTMNTMLFESEIERAIDAVGFLYDNDVDALLIQDLGLFHLVREMFPDFAVHCSTQMHIHNLAGVRYMKAQGAERVVLARETPIELIREAVKEGIDIETFVYGAICVSYSGQCLMSEAVKNRSANRGMCAQCCRLRYEEGKGNRSKAGDYLLSPKDLNLIDDVGTLIDAGIASLKIEGRMKRPEYVYLVTKTFREAIDAHYRGEEYRTSKERQKELLEMFNRGFSRGHIFHDDVKARMNPYRPNHQGVPAGRVLAAGHGKVTVKLTDSLYQRDGLRILNTPHDTGLTAVKIEKKGKLVSEAYPGDTVTLDCHDDPPVHKGQTLLKTSDTVLLDRIDHEIADAERKINVSIHYTARIGQPLEVDINDEDGFTAAAVSEQNLEAAKNAPIQKAQMEKQLKRTGDFPFAVKEMAGEIGRVFVPVSLINETRRRACELLMQERSVRHRRNGMKPYAFKLKQPETDRLPVLLVEDRVLNREHIPEAEVVYIGEKMTPVVQEEEKICDGSDMVLSEIGSFYGKHENCIAGMTMNIANSYALAYVLSQPGITGAVVSSECSEEQIQAMLEAFRQRYGFTPFIYRLVYGHRSLMYIKDRFSPDSPDVIEDFHGQDFPVKYNREYTEILEKEPYVSANAYASGSFLILDESDTDTKEIEQEAYEEISARI